VLHLLLLFTHELHVQDELSHPEVTTLE
jgi:hypothetical protein